MAAAVPAAARTTIAVIPGAAATRTEVGWLVPTDSPLVTAFAFLAWEAPAAPAAGFVVKRSSLAGAIMVAARRPIDSQLAVLDGRSFLTRELKNADASAMAHELDKVGILSQSYDLVDDWASTVKTHAAALAALPGLLLSDSSFEETDAFDARGGGRRGPSELEMLQDTSLGQLLRVTGDDCYGLGTLTLARATWLCASKDTRVERDDPVSMLRKVAERVSALALRVMRQTSATRSSLADEFVRILQTLHLPRPFARLHSTPFEILGELNDAYSYSFGNNLEGRAVEQRHILRAPRVYAGLKQLLGAHSDTITAWVGIESLSAELLPSTVASSPLLVKLAQLDTELSTAEWDCRCEIDYYMTLDGECAVIESE